MSIDFRHLDRYLMTFKDYHRIIIQICIDKETVTSFCVNIKYGYIHYNY